MAHRYTRSTTTTAELTAEYHGHRDEEVMHALVSAGALVALSDGQLKPVERDELMNFIDQQEFVPTISRHEIAEGFDEYIRQLKGRHSANVIVETLRPLAGLSLASVVLRTAERVAAADRKIHLGELQALKLIRMVLMTLPAKRHSALQQLAESSK